MARTIVVDKHSKSCGQGQDLTPWDIWKTIKRDAIQNTQTKETKRQQGRPRP